MRRMRGSRPQSVCPYWPTQRNGRGHYEPTDRNLKSVRKALSHANERLRRSPLPQKSCHTGLHTGMERSKLTCIGSKKVKEALSRS